MFLTAKEIFDLTLKKRRTAQMRALRRMVVEHKVRPDYYQVPPGLETLWEGKKTLKLGDTLHAAYLKWAERLPRQDSVNTINQLLDSYAREVVPTNYYAIAQCEVPKKIACRLWRFTAIPNTA